MKGLEGKGKERKCPRLRALRSIFSRESFHLLTTQSLNFFGRHKMTNHLTTWAYSMRTNQEKAISNQESRNDQSDPFYFYLQVLSSQASSLLAMSPFLLFGLNGGGILFLTSIRIRSLMVAYRSGRPRIRKGALVD